ATTPRRQYRMTLEDERAWSDVPEDLIGKENRWPRFARMNGNGAVSVAMPEGVSGRFHDQAYAAGDSFEGDPEITATLADEHGETIEALVGTDGVRFDNISAATRAANNRGLVDISPAAAARVVRAAMRRTGAKLGGCHCTGNPGQAFSSAPVTTAHFVVGDLVVIDAPGSPLNFDTRFKLKEDYDFTCQHLAAHGTVVRCNRLLAQFKHRDNAGGAVDDRTFKKERDMIRLLKHKWPGVFRPHTARAKKLTEVILFWASRDTEQTLPVAGDPPVADDDPADDPADDDDPPQEDEDEDPVALQPSDDRPPAKRPRRCSYALAYPE
ncbi:MAG: hypothetical protein AAFQ17_06055, partial [Pseudomonadota bacterium]